MVPHLRRILFANPIAALGGAELFLLEMLSELRERMPDAELHLVTGMDGALAERAAKIGVECHALPMPAALSQVGDSSVRRTGRGGLRRLASSGVQTLSGGAALLAYARRYRRLINSIRPTLVFSNGLKFHAITGLAGCGQAPLVWFMHDYLGSRALMRRVLPCLAGSVALVLANSRSVAADVGRVLPRLPREVVYCGIDRGHFSPRDVDAGKLDLLAGCPPLPSNGVRVGLVATFARWKGQDLLLEAAARVIQQGLPVPVRFYIIGGPIYSTSGSQFSAAELRELAAKQGISEHVGFVPFQDDTADIYRSLDVVVHASRHPEPFGRTILEAMSCGRAMIATQAGGAAEIFQSGESAVGFPMGDVNSLSKEIHALCVSSERRHELGMKARDATALFSRACMGERLHAYLDRL